MLLFGLLGAGCTAVKESPAPAVAPAAPSAPAATIANPIAAPPAVPSTARPAAPAPTTSAPATARSPPAAATAPAKAAPAAASQVASGATVEAAKPKAPTLDLKSLEARLKETQAIGVLTKLSLKNQVDDLLGQFRAFYQGKLKTTLAELRRPFDLLVLKLLSLLQDSDPSLAAAIAASREAIWAILSDRAKFAALDGG